MVQPWRSGVTAMERYENIERIEKIRSAVPHTEFPNSAQQEEHRAFNESGNRQDYDAACGLYLEEPGVISPSNAPAALGPHITHNHAGGHSDNTGVRIGEYEDCQYIASGVTAEVYRHNDMALKVITEMHNIAPHDPRREVEILKLLKKPCIPLLKTFFDQEQRLTMVFPYLPMTLADLLRQGQPLSKGQIRVIFSDLCQALSNLHGQGIIHRDVKPQAVLLASPDGPAMLSDFGTAWHPQLSSTSEPANAKILDIGTGPYRAPEALFGDKSYGTGTDMWAVGCMLAECTREPPSPLFESRAAHEDGNQLGLILSIFKTMGSPTPETWPEALKFRTPPFEIYQEFKGRPLNDLLDNSDAVMVNIVRNTVKYSSDRMAPEKIIRMLQLGI